MNAEVCKQFDISRSVTSAYHPQTNGLDERTNKTLKTRLAKLINEHQNNWDQFLEEVAFSMRTQNQGSTKFSPFFLMFGRHPRTPIEVQCNLCWVYSYSLHCMQQTQYIYELCIGVCRWKMHQMKMKIVN